MLGAVEPPIAGWGRGAARVAVAVAAAGLGAVALPAAATIGAPVHAAIWQGAVGALLAAVVCALALPFARAWYFRPLGVAIAGVACWLLAQASYPVAAWLIAPTLGLAVAFASGGVARMGALRGNVMTIRLLLPAVGGAALIIVVRVVSGRDGAMACGAALVAASAAAAALFGLPWHVEGCAPRLLAIGGSVIALITAGYIGATTPSVTWFGSLVHHGPRGGHEVAITFDDGPDPPYTLEVSAILDNYGVKGTFFTVGKALEARPDVSKALLDDGHLLGNHSYHHDAFRWLDPRYPELEETQQAFKRTLGVCPALYRPPHGSHTPFMAKVVSDHGMNTVTWDVSAADWATDDGALVAQRVLSKVRPGSIILLHDGSDGNIGADRSVLLTALPIILDGLRERGLNPVRLDTLLGVRGYLENC
jgi:peptidoglycan/xylan/chitin deacetylase (PgdA/CDA1 family)